MQEKQGRNRAVITPVQQIKHCERQKEGNGFYSSKAEPLESMLLAE
jgi:hypothetical protein